MEQVLLMRLLCDLTHMAELCREGSGRDRIGWCLFPLREYIGCYLSPVWEQPPGSTVEVFWMLGYSELYFILETMWFDRLNVCLRISGSPDRLLSGSLCPNTPLGFVYTGFPSATIHHALQSQSGWFLIAGSCIFYCWIPPPSEKENTSNVT